MEEIKCPYCGFEQEIDHECNYGYEEDETHSQECSACGKTFAYNTIITYDYKVKKCSCFNGGKHKWKRQPTFPKCASKMECTVCGKVREMTDDERKGFGIETKEEYFEKLKLK